MWEKVLVADGTIETRGMFYETLSSLCYKVTCVPSGEEALGRLVDERFEVIVLDEAMAGMGGIEAAKKIREFDTETKIVLLTAEESDQATLEEVGGVSLSAVVKKDFSTHIMMKKILEILKTKKAAVETIEEGTRKAHILLTDDNDEVRDVMGSFLTKKGYRVSTAANGEEALMKVKVDRPDVVFLDMRMPGMDGLMVLQKIKELDESINVVMLTSAQEEYIVEEAKKQGACDYLIKPCNLEELDALITSLLLPKRA